MYRSPAEVGRGVVTCLLLLGSPSLSATDRRKELEWSMLLAVTDAKSFAGMWGFPPGSLVGGCWTHIDSCRSGFLF